MLHTSTLVFSSKTRQVIEEEQGNSLKKVGLSHHTKIM